MLKKERLKDRKTGRTERKTERKRVNEREKHDKCRKPQKDTGVFDCCLVEAKAAAMSTLGVGCFKAQLRRLEPKALLWGSRARWPRRLVDSPRAPSWKGGDARAICLRSATEAGNMRWKRKAAATISYRGHRSGRGFCNFVASARAIALCKENDRNRFVARPFDVTSVIKDFC